jgi:hypothetical protein
LAGYTPKFIESGSVSADVDAAKAVPVFVKVVLRHVAPRATGFYIEE